MDKIILFLIFLVIASRLNGQEEKNTWQVGGLWSGEFNAAVKDQKIGAAQTPFYEEHKWGAQSWLNLNAYNQRWRFEVRLDGYQNSILRNPEDVYTRYGIGYLNATYATPQFSVEAGHFYDQIGQGLIMRSYRDLNLQIDNSIFGAKLQWRLPANHSIMVYAGWPTDDFDAQKMFNAGGEYRKIWKINDVVLSSGAGVSWKRYHSAMTDALIDELRFYHPEDKVPLYRHGWLGTVFQELNAGALTWNAEFAVKYHDPYFNVEETRQLVTGQKIAGRFETAPGQALYSQASLDFSGISVGVEGKYIHRFVNKSDPFSFDYRNELNFIPPAVDVRTYRLQARYIPATQFLGEKSLNVFVLLPLKDHLLEWKKALIFRLNGVKLYDDYDVQWSWNRDSDRWVAGLMYQVYNQSIYEGKQGKSIIRSTIPYAEYYRTWADDKSFKTEAQALFTRQDKGSLYFMSMEFSWNQHWSLFGSGMYQPRADLWYPSTGLFYSNGGGRYGVSFVKQLDGYVCSGGICRYEPAYSGFKLEFQQRL